MRTVPLPTCTVCGLLGAFSNMATGFSPGCNHIFGPVREGGVQSCRLCGHSHTIRWDARITCVDVQDREARKVCRQCEAPLEGRRTVYCSPACSDEFDRNHFWTAARGQALKLAHHRCSRPYAGEPVPPSWDATSCLGRRLEVNHIVPVVGATRAVGCFNHQSNLEVLCHTHHVEVTNAQRRSRNATERSDPGKPATFRVVGPRVRG